MEVSKEFAAQFDALNSGSGFVVLKDWSTITMNGEDRHSFLHNMCTNEIKKLSPGESCEAFCTDVKGKIVAHVFVRAWSDRIELLAVPGQAESLIGHLDRYIIREDVSLTNSSEEVSWLIFGASTPNIAIEFSDVIREPFGKLPITLLRVPKSRLPEMVASSKEQGTVECSYDVWETMRIEAAIPLFGIDFDTSHLPQEINRDEQAINFNKGCYLGQETIARIDALGHVNQKSVLLLFDGETTPDVGIELSLEDKNVGHITSSCWSPKASRPLALAMVRRGSNDLHTELESQSGIAVVIAKRGIAN